MCRTRASAGRSRKTSRSGAASSPPLETSSSTVRWKDGSKPFTPRPANFFGSSRPAPESSASRSPTAGWTAASTSQFCQVWAAGPARSCPAISTRATAPRRSASSTQWPTSRRLRTREGHSMSSAFRSVLALLTIVLLASAAQARELRVCADPNNLPFSNERLEGFENKIVELIAQELDADIHYTWWAQRRGFIRNTLKANDCDLTPGTVGGLPRVRSTKPYYRSTYVFVTRSDTPEITSLDDPA